MNTSVATKLNKQPESDSLHTSDAFLSRLLIVTESQINYIVPMGHSRSTLTDV
jgi:hypothetical protein